MVVTPSVAGGADGGELALGAGLVAAAEATTGAPKRTCVCRADVERAEWEKTLAGQPAKINLFADSYPLRPMLALLAAAFLMRSRVRAAAAES